MKITPNSLTINQLLSSTNEQFVIPAYQRRYSWRERQIHELIDDVCQVDKTDTHLLGSIVCLTGTHTANVNELELVDGQQRLTTVIILLHCIRDRLKDIEESDNNFGLHGLLTAKAHGGPELTKLKLESLDSGEFVHLVSDRDNAEEYDYKNRNLASAFLFIRNWICQQDSEQLHSFLYKLQNQVLIIRLDVSEAKDAFKLFETINNRGLKLNPTDIVKNFVLGNAARLGETQLDQARNSWAKLIAHLDGADTDAFFRYFLISILKRRVTTTEVVPAFKAMFMNDVREATNLPDQHQYADEENLDSIANNNNDDEQLRKKKHKKISFKQLLARLVANAKVYGDLILVKTGDTRIDRHLHNLKLIKAAQTYGYLMHLRVGKIDDKDFIKILKLTENFILRRHICRERANETEALFARLCSIDPQNPIAKTKDAYRQASPSDVKFKEEFASFSFTSSIIDRARYCLEQIELSKHSRYTELMVGGSELVHVEHIMPQKIKTKRAKKELGDWISYLGSRAEHLHPKYVAQIGNLTLFAGPLNIGASNNPFAKKKNAYKESGILITKELLKLRAFKFKQIDTRSAELAAIAVILWPLA